MTQSLVPKDRVSGFEIAEAGLDLDEMRPKTSSDRSLDKNLPGLDTVASYLQRIIR